MKILNAYPDNKVHGANMGPIWDPGGLHVSPMNFVIWVCFHYKNTQEYTVYQINEQAPVDQSGLNKSLGLGLHPLYKVSLTLWVSAPVPFIYITNT